MDRERQTTTAGRSLAERVGRAGLWTNHLDAQPIERLRAVVAELEQLGWGALWCWKVFGREAPTNARLLLCATRRMVIATGIANIWARDPAAMAAAQRTLTEAYPGRFVLGIGVSHAPIVDARGHRYQRPRPAGGRDGRLGRPGGDRRAGARPSGRRRRPRLPAGPRPDADGVPMTGWRGPAPALLGR